MIDDKNNTKVKIQGAVSGSFNVDIENNNDDFVEEYSIAHRKYILEELVHGVKEKNTKNKIESWFCYNGLSNSMND